jgi:hypothetical protein
MQVGSKLMPLELFLKLCICVTKLQTV